jgi:hypothetical protein
VKQFRIEGCEDKMISNRIISVSSGARVLLLLLILTLSWTATAQAQEGPADNEYGNPADIPAAGDTGGDTAAGGTGGDPGSGGAGVLAAADTGGDPGSGGAGVLAASSAPASGIVGVLPLTGGAALFTLGAGVLLTGGGLVARRMLR